MANTRVLITGGAGFIGSHLADELLARGYRVRALDSLVPAVHGEDRARPDHLAPEVELVQGDIRDRVAVDRALKAVDAVFHLAARNVGSSVDALGTAVLLGALERHPVEKLVFGSSMTVYGEGLYRTPDAKVVEVQERTLQQLQDGRWEPTGPQGEPLEVLPTPETKTPTPRSAHAVATYHQERLFLANGAASAIPTVALRFFNVYGPRMALGDPHAGVLALFAARLLSGAPPRVLEDGLQQRDFVNVRDVVRACRMALESSAAAGGVFNVGSGSSMTIRTVAAQIADALGRRELRPEVTGDYRAGDVRHCFADTTLAAKVLGYEAHLSFTEGLLELREWLARQGAERRTAEICARIEARELGG
ncbi:MAG TPA: NAD-dependent epimerase/dehydratase family protein [Myxococcaceae bacterium]